MSVAESSVTRQELAGPTPRRWTREEYYQIYEQGIFQGQRVELIRGEILKMSPMRVPHARAVELARRAIEAAYDKGYWIRNQLPLLLSDSSEPESDLAVVIADPRDAAEDHPRSALLIVEISESTLEFDQNVKRQLYAEAGNPRVLDHQLD